MIPFRELLMRLQPVAGMVFLACAAPFLASAQSSPVATGRPAGPAGPDSAAAPAAPTSATSATTALPDKADETLPAVVVTATRSPQPLAQAIPQTTRFDRADIEASSAQDLPGLLALAPGAQIVRNGGAGATASLLLRGAASNQTLVLVDGVRMESVSAGGAPLEQILPDQIDRIEVVNGNVSALYGSGASGGVVQVFTRDGGNHPPRFYVDAQYGSYRTQRQHAGVSGALDASGDTTFALDLSRYRTGGFSAIDPVEARNVYSGAAVNPDRDSYSNSSVSGTVRHRFGNDWDAGVRFYDSTGRLDYDDVYAALAADVQRQHSRVRTLAAFVNGRLGRDWTTHLNIAQSDDDTTSLLNGATDGRFNTRNRQLTWQNEFALAAASKLVFGYERLEQQLDSDAYAAPDRHVDSGFAGIDSQIGRNHVQLNVRRDQYSDFGGANSYYAGWAYALTQRWQFSASLSDAFRAPGFNDLYYPEYGNPSLRPERSHSIEAALQYELNAASVARVSVFRTRYTDLLQAALLGGAYLAQNVGRARVSGVEASVSAQVAATDLRASLTVQSPVDQDTGEDLNRRARRFATLSATHRIGRWRVGGEWLVSGARQDSGTPLGGYAVLNVSARAELGHNWYAALHLDNLLDKRYELAYTYNTPRRGAYLTLGWRQ
jgi:vitamin B12 transporter